MVDCVKNRNVKCSFDEGQVELNNCYFVKTILMLLVVAYHSVLFFGGAWFVGTPMYKSKVLGVLAQWLNSYHIYAFVFVSGYLFYFSRYELGKYSKFSTFFINKIKRLIIPYIFVSIIWVVPFALFFYEYDVVDVLKRYLLGAAPNQLWFLLMLFGVYVIFYLLSGYFEQNNVGGALVILLIYVFGWIGQAMFPNVFQVFSACLYTPLFWLGFKIRQFGSCRVRLFPSFVWLLADILLFALVQYLIGFEGFVFEILESVLSLILHMVGALMAFIVLQEIADSLNWKKSRAISCLCKFSMPIYLFHQQVIYVFLYCLNGMLNPYVHALVNFIGAMLVSFLISKLLMKFKMTRFLLGEK